MEHALVAALAIALFFSLRYAGRSTYRVKIVRVPVAPVTTRTAAPKVARPAAAPIADAAEIRSALVNLGCKMARASQIAEAAMTQGTDFDSRLRWALQNVTAAA